MLGWSCVFATVNTLQIVLAATVSTTATTTTTTNNNNFKRRKYYLFADCHVSDLLVIKYSVFVFVVIYSQIIKTSYIVYWNVYNAASYKISYSSLVVP